MCILIMSNFHEIKKKCCIETINLNSKYIKYNRDRANHAIFYKQIIFD